MVGMLASQPANELTKGFVVDQTDVEILLIVVNDRLDRVMNVGLIQIVRVARSEIFPFTRIDFVLGMNPNLGFVEPVKGRVVQQVFLYQLRRIVLFIDKMLFEMGSHIISNKNQQHGENQIYNISSFEHIIHDIYCVYYIQ
jgi:hypothetical protein